MADQVDKVTIQLVLQDLFSGNAGKVEAAAKKLAATLNGMGAPSAGGLAAGLLGLGGGVGLAAIFEKALGEARLAQEASDRLAASLNGNLDQLQAVSDVAAQVSEHSVFLQRDLIDAAQHMIERGIPLNRIQQAIQVVADTASALQRPINEVADDVARTFSGTVPRTIGQSVPALRDLSTEALRSGAALDLLGQRYNGMAQKFKQTTSGSEKNALKDITQGWTDIGKAMLPIEQTLLPQIADQMKKVAEPFQESQIIGWGNEFKNLLSQFAGGLAYIGAFASSLVSEPFVLAGLAAVDLFDNIKVLGLEAISYLVGKFKAEIASAAAEIDKLTAHMPSWMGGKTNLAGSVTGWGDSLASWITGANADANKAHAAFMSEWNSGPISQANAAAAGPRDEIIAAVQRWLGIGPGSSAAQQQTAWQAHQLANAAQDRITLSQGTSQAEDDTLGTLQKQTEEFQKQLEIRKLRATATIDGTGPEGAKATAAADLAELKVQQQQELNQLIADGGDKEQQNALIAVQTLETKAKTVEVTRQQAEAEIQALNAAKAAYQATVEHNANLVKVGQMSPLQARQSDVAALTDYQAKVKEVNDAVAALLKKGVLSPEQAAAILQQLQTYEEKAKEINNEWQQDAAEMERAANEGLVHTLTEIEEKTKTVKKAFADLAKSILNDLLNISNQHLVDSLFGGGGSGKGGDGGGGGQGGGGLIGSILQSLFPGKGNGQQGGSSGGPSTTVTPTVSPSSGSPPTTPGAGGGPGISFSSVGQGIGNLFQGAGNVIGGVLNGAGQIVGGLASGIGSAVGGVASAAAGAASSVGSTVMSALPSLLALFGKGGYTGDGPSNQAAGIVHRGEYVLDASTVKALGGPGSVASMMSGPAARAFPSMVGRAVNLSSLGNSRDIASTIASGVENAMARGMKHVGALPAVVHFGPETADQFFREHPDAINRAMDSSPNMTRGMAKRLQPMLGRHGK